MITVIINRDITVKIIVVNILLMESRFGENADEFFGKSSHNIF